MASRTPPPRQRRARTVNFELRGRRPFFLEGIKSGAVSVVRTNEFMYRDWVSGVRNKIEPLTVENPHLVLRDQTGRPRVALDYHVFNHQLTILSIQQLRTQYSKSNEGTVWNASKESDAARQLKHKLAGRSPAEFLMAAFLFHYRSAIRRGWGVKLQINSRFHKQHAGIIERFFDKSKRQLMDGIDPNAAGDTIFEIYPLAMSKKRVIDILNS